MELKTKQSIINQIIQKINDSSFIAIAGHVSPDGDSVASCLALAMSVKKLGKTPVVLLEDVPNRYKSISGGREFIRTEPPCDTPDLFISCDCASKERMGKFEELFDKTDETIVIDHHISNTGYGKINYIDGFASSASEMVYDVIDTIGNIDKDIAAALYAGIIFDTGALRFKSTSPQTMIKISKLMEYGIAFDEIYADMMLTHSYQAAMIFSKAIAKMKFMDTAPVIYSFITTDEMKNASASRGDLEGAVGYMLNTEGAEVSILVSEISENESKASFRSHKFDVNLIASHFGGGGHTNAAGATIQANAEAALEQVLSLMAERYDCSID